MPGSTFLRDGDAPLRTVEDEDALLLQARATIPRSGG
jgi:hypothetical protein